MQALKTANNARTLPLLLDAGVPLIITAVLWATSLYDATLLQVIAAFILCWIPWAAYQEWVRGTRERIPLFALLGVVYWLAYAVPLFWLSHDISLITGRQQLSEDSITGSLYLTVLGVAALGVGIKVAGRWRFMDSFRPDIHRSPSRWNYLRLAGKFRWRGNHGYGGLYIRKTKTPARCDHDRDSHCSFPAARQREVSAALLAYRCFRELRRA